MAEVEKKRILEAIVHLPPHPEVKQALAVLKKAGLRMVTLTNSSQKAVEQQVRNAGLTEFFEKHFSMDSIQRYKPAPETYRMVAAGLGVEIGQLRLVAAHGWDILGAMQAGCSAAFVARKGQSLFPLVKPPDVIGSDLSAVAEQIVLREKG